MAGCGVLPDLCGRRPAGGNLQWLARLQSIASIPTAVREQFTLLTYEHHYKQLQRLLQLVPPTPVPYNQLLDTYEIYDPADG
jgi:hypothetical protein